jgi:phage repressor protein C with HTH and peptisase S24 domain
LGWADNYINQLQTDEIIQFRPRGNSMVPKINSGDLVTVSSDISKIEKGDIVLCKVNGNQYLHLVTAISGNRYQISNNQGYTNGWTQQVYGKVIKVEK